MGKRVITKGRAISERTARAIIHRAKRASSVRDCPYRYGWVQWTVWVTAFNYKQFTNAEIYRSLVKAGVPCNG